MTADDTTDPTLTDVLRTLNEIDSQDLDDDFDIVMMTDWRVGSDGRLHIPAPKRDKYDIEEGDHIDAILRVPTSDGGE